MSNEVNEILEIDKRSLPEIWANLNDAEKSDLRDKLMKKFGCTTVTVWNWTNGNTTPPSIFDREIIAKVVKSRLRLNVTPETLFPPKQ